MIDSWIIVSAALAYLSALFLIAWLGDRRTAIRPDARGRPAVYALSLAIYCTSWTFFGSVGLAATTGLDFIPVYLGPIIFFAVGWPFLIRIVRVAKSQNTTSIADFLAARYGKSQGLAALVTIICVLGIVPYIALQLKAVSLSVETIISSHAPGALGQQSFVVGDIAFSVAMLMAVFAVLFGTRHIDATEHQEGLILAVATESIVKIACFMAVGIYVTWGMFDGLADLYAKAAASPRIAGLFQRGIDPGYWLASTFLSFACIILLPRQFHVSVVESNSEHEIRRAAWLFPLYLVLINLFVVPIAVAGLLTFPAGTVDVDTFVLALPLKAGAPVATLLAFIGGLSAATAMVIVSSVTLSVMVCNGIAVPFILFRRQAEGEEKGDRAGEALGPLLITIRRVVIFSVLALAFVFYWAFGKSVALVSIGLLSFAAIAQLAPAFFGGLIWRRATARGAIAGLSSGFAVWGYTLLLPWVIKAGWGPRSILQDGPFGIGALRPEMLINVTMHPLTHGVLCSMLANGLAYVVVSLMKAPEPIERLQANIFIPDDQPRGTLPAFRLWRTSVTVGDLQRTVARYLGAERAARSFKQYAAPRGAELLPHAEADIHILRFTETLLASAIGAPSSRLVLSLLLKRRSVGDQSSLRLLDDASEALQHNRDLLQSAIDQVPQGLAVFDRNLRLICWNRQFRELLELPPEFGRVGAPIHDILGFLAARGDLGTGRIELLVRDRVMKLTGTMETYQERRILGGKRVLEVRTSRMPLGGFVTTYSDITERVEAAEELERANETLERRVRERTAELTKVNQALAGAKAKADEANLAKTRFLAAASHDILQPLNAARLYTTSLVDRSAVNGAWRSDADSMAGEGAQALVRNIDASLESVEEILGTLLEISRLDAGQMPLERSTFAVQDLFEQMRREFEPAARETGLDLRIVATSTFVVSDRRLLRRMLQNLVSNAIKYTRQGKVLIGVRRRGATIVIEVADTGLGIAPEKQALVFKEFERLPETAASVKGLGLGLSIVERIGLALDHPVSLASMPGRGSAFFLVLPAGDPAAAEPRPVGSRAPGPSLRHLTVLCIDNEPAILSGMRALLGTWGLSALTAASGTEAITMLQQAGVPERMRMPDLILADYHLDHGTGIDAIRGIRSALGAEIAGVIITADTAPDTQLQVRQAGLTLLRKPLKAAALRALLAQASLVSMAAE